MPKEEFEKAEKGNLYKVDSRSLIEDPDFNEREDYGDIEGLAAEIEALGVTTPLKCYKQGEFYVVIRGHRRRAALRYLWEKKGIWMMVKTELVEKKKSNPEEWVLDQITSNDGKSLTPWEQAKVLKKLINYGWKEEDIVKKSGKSNTYVKRLLSLANAPQKLINLVREGTVSGTLAMDMIADGKTEEVIKKGEEGVLIPHPLDMELFGTSTKPPRVPKITAADIKPNSVKIFKKWAPSVDETKLPPQKVEFLQWLKLLMDGGLTAEDMQKFFS